MKGERVEKSRKARAAAFFQKRRKLLDLLIGAAKYLGYGLAGFLLSRVSVLEGVMPFGLALVVGAPDKYSAAALVGFVVNAWFGGSIVSSSTYIAAAGVAASVKWILLTVFRRYKRDSYIPTLTAALLSVAITDFAVLALTGALSWPAAGLLLCELALIAAFSYFYYRAGAVLNDFRGITGLSSTQSACLALALCSLTMALYPLEIGVVSLGRMAAGIGAAAAFFFLETPVALGFAAACGAGVMLSEPGFSFAAAGLMIAGALASLLKARGKPLYALVFLGAAALFAVSAGNYPYAVVYLFEVVLCTLLFLLLPVKSPYSLSVAKGSDLRRSAALAVEARLVSISAAMRDIGGILDRVSQPPKKYSVMDDIYNKSIERVCRNCPLMSYCWIKCYGETVESLTKLTPLLQQTGRVRKEDVLMAFKSRCINTDNLGAEINRRYSNYLDEQRYKRNTKLFRGILKRQFSALSEMLGATAQELRGLSNWDEQRSGRIFDAAVRLRLPILSANCVFDDSGHPTVTVDFKSEVDPALHRRFLSAMSGIAGATMAQPVLKTEAGRVNCVYTEQPRYILKTAVTQQPAVGEICGDVYTVFADTRGTVHMVLADGMGTGVAAARDGAVCCAFMRRLMENGFPAIRAAELANSTMAMKEDSERACTLDSLSFNMFSGATTIFKAGAAPTYIVKKSEIRKFSHPTLPVGILGEVVGKDFSLALAAGDLVLMISDGVIAESSDFLVPLLKQHREQTPEQICREIKEQLAGINKNSDDVTIMVAKVTSSHEEI